MQVFRHSSGIYEAFVLIKNTEKPGVIEVFRVWVSLYPLMVSNFLQNIKEI